MSKTSILAPVVAAIAPRGAGAFDLITLADIKLELQITDKANDAWLAKAISQASTAINNFCNRTFRTQTYSETIWPDRDLWPRQLSGTFAPLQLSRWPIVSPPSLASTAPPLAPVATAATGGSLAAGVYYAAVSYVTAFGETALSSESMVAVPANGSITIAAPGPDAEAIATGWNCYIGTASFAETLQNGTPQPIADAVTASSLISGTPLPSFVGIVEHQSESKPLVEGLDFKIDRDLAQITRLRRSGFSGQWAPDFFTVTYQAGYAVIPDDVQDAATQLVKFRWFARGRDPSVRSDNAGGVYEAQYWFGTGPGGAGDLPTYVQDKIGRYRVPVII